MFGLVCLSPLNQCCRMYEVTRTHKSRHWRLRYRPVSDQDLLVRRYQAALAISIFASLGSIIIAQMVGRTRRRLPIPVVAGILKTPS